jgi:hypothetical protein
MISVWVCWGPLGVRWGPLGVRCTVGEGRRVNFSSTLSFFDKKVL